MPRLVGLAVLAATTLLLGACAPGRQIMRYSGNGDAESGRVWPAVQTGEVPRYRYVGQLTGEGNFVPEGGQSRGVAVSLLRWIVGLDEGRADPVVLQRPQSGMVDSRGRVLVTDVSRKAVFVFDEKAGALGVWDRATVSDPWLTPIGLTEGPDGEIWVADADHGEVFRLGPEGEPRGRFGKGLFGRPTGIVRDAATRRTFVADTQRHLIRIFDDQGSDLGALGSRGEGPGELNFPVHLALARGELYVTDVMNSRVQVFDDRGSSRLAFGSPGLYVGNLVRPKGVAVDDEGNIYVVESMYDTLLVFDPRGRLLMSIGGSGTDVGRFYLPAGVWTDRNNRVFVADMFNGRVVVFQFLGGS